MTNPEFSFDNFTSAFILELFFVAIGVKDSHEGGKN